MLRLIRMMRCPLLCLAASSQMQPRFFAGGSSRGGRHPDRMPGGRDRRMRDRDMGFDLDKDGDEEEQEDKNDIRKRLIMEEKKKQEEMIKKPKGPKKYIERKYKDSKPSEHYVIDDPRLMPKDIDECLKNKQELKKKMGTLVEEQKKLSEEWGTKFHEECFRFEREWKEIVDATKGQ
eukprot:TRINITY_DN11144_c0_g1_i8.p1 TRINITY_DN11144_c0_g1~~TRINITY_DN11144_c0_g1_i8.p1  ORF type:complete len:177 (-),score=62.83 TRINITY_DN11144_c0_g1_i8:791-1321(-)